MTHTPADQKKLDTMTTLEKNKRTSRQSFIDRGNMVKGYTHWYITRNEYPHDGRGEEQYVLRNRRTPKNNMSIGKAEGAELGKIIIEWRDYDILIHKRKDRSVGRFHVHIFR